MATKYKNYIEARSLKKLLACISIRATGFPLGNKRSDLILS